MTRTPHLLLTNDDGISAPGLLALRQALSGLGRLTVIAPDHNWSASGHSRTFFRPLTVRPTTLADGSPAFMTDGAPSDCVALAVLGFIKEKIDLVVSGINYGSNMGADVTYSGTVAAAMEASISGIPSIAISLDTYGASSYHYETAAAFAAILVAQMLKRRLARDIILNVNVPDLPIEQIAGVQITRLGKRIYRDVLEERYDPQNGSVCYIGGERPDGVMEEGTDVKAVADGYISVTPIHLDLTDHRLLESLAKWDLGSQWRAIARHQ